MPEWLELPANIDRLRQCGPKAHKRATKELSQPLRQDAVGSGKGQDILYRVTMELILVSGQNCPDPDVSPEPSGRFFGLSSMGSRGDREQSAMWEHEVSLPKLLK